MILYRNLTARETVTYTSTLVEELRSARLRDESTGLLLRSHVVRQATRAGVVAARIVV